MFDVFIALDIVRWENNKNNLVDHAMYQYRRTLPMCLVQTAAVFASATNVWRARLAGTAAVVRYFSWTLRVY